MSMRLGLIGTGYWARTVHAASAQSHPNVTFVGVWGRNQERTAQLANDFNIKPYADPDALIGDVDALTFAVPPDVQAPIAIRAASRGRHLLLEKPIAISAAFARELEQEVDRSHVASIVFFTQRFVEETQRWVTNASETGGWVDGRVEYLSNIYTTGGPFAESAWRREHGALWDLGPHALSLLWPVLGPVTAVSAGRGVGDLVHLILRHSAGQSSTVSVSLTSPLPAPSRLVYIDGLSGRLSLPTTVLERSSIVQTHQAALTALIDQAAERAPSHPCDVHLGARVVEVLAAADESLTRRCWVELA